MELACTKAHGCAKFVKTRFLNVSGTLLALIFTIVSFCSVCPQKAQAGQATLAWDASSPAGVIGYKLYYGTSSGNYSQSIDVGNSTSYTVSNLTDGQTYYFAAKAYDSAGNLSGYSNEASKTITSTAPATQSLTVNLGGAAAAP
jgi:fibronectin type 3 domain-containing protein